MNYLVTGGAGFIGSHLIYRLLAEGNRVIALDNFSDNYRREVKQRNLLTCRPFEDFRILEGDIRDTSALDECFSHHQIDIVIHLAGRPGVRPSLLEPELYYDVNIIGTLRLLESMRRHKVTRMIFASSSSVYGDADSFPSRESDPANCTISPYAATKKSGELLCYSFHRTHGFQIFCLRLFSVYGPRQRPDMAIYKFVKKALCGQPIVLYGDGTSRRDYTYIDDLVDGLIRSLSVLRGFEIINIGNSRNVSLNDLIALVAKVLQKELVLEWNSPQPGDAMITSADLTKARELLGYNPRVTIEEGVQMFVKWFKETVGERREQIELL